MPTDSIRERGLAMALLLLFAAALLAGPAGPARAQPPIEIPPQIAADPAPAAPWVDAIDKNAYRVESVANHLELDSPLEWVPFPVDDEKRYDYFSFRLLLKSAESDSFSLALRSADEEPSPFAGIAWDPGPCVGPQSADLQRIMARAARDFTGDPAGPAIYSEEAGRKLFASEILAWRSCHLESAPVRDDKGNFQRWVTVLVRASALPAQLDLRALHPHWGVLRASEPTTLELVASPAHLAVVGDSVIWGQGHLEANKYHARLATRIRQLSGGEVRTFFKAHSGATVNVDDGDACGEEEVVGEVPRSRPSIVCQFDRIPEPERLDVIVFNGCINDVDALTVATGLVVGDAGVSRIAEGDLRTRIREKCGEDVRRALERFRQRAPNAVILVAGYFPLLSLNSIASCPTQLAIGGITVVGAAAGGGAAAIGAIAIFGPLALPILPGATLSGAASGAANAILLTEAATAAFLHDAERRSRLWIAESDTSLSNAAQAVAQDPALRGLGAGTAVWVGISNRFTGREAFTAASWLYGVDCVGTAQDPVAVRSIREENCPLYHDTDSIADQIGRQKCLRASAFHPNANGLAYIAERLGRQMETLGLFRPLGETSE